MTRRDDALTDTELDAALAASSPLAPGRAAELPLDAAQSALLDELLSQAPAPAHAPRRLRHRTRGDHDSVPRGHARRFVPRVAGAAAVVTVVMMVFLSLGDGPGGGRDGGSVWAAEQLRFAEASPLVLLGADGWRVEYADEQSKEEGELHFRLGPTPPPGSNDFTEGVTPEPVPADTTAAQLNWRGGSYEMWTRDRYKSAVASSTAPVLGTTAKVYQYDGGTRGHRDITAIFRYDDRILEFRAGAAGMSAFKALLATLTAADTDTWLSAMPDSVVKAADRDGAVDQMLAGIPLPRGFTAADIPDEQLTKDRYQLGAHVTGAVACRWLKQWNDARQAGDVRTRDAAIAAMATAKDWPILREMTKEGDYPEAIVEYAAAMRSGTYHGRPLIGDVGEGLGCAERGVELPQGSSGSAG
ncbi:hypothetical protein DSM112329_03239 [Paraconexibacter sp. AEG42_29]|uniref:Uncharacterized protein n=1 Tax=Paraconexibacter sp. AEG42_29 TaxID=2997339 RepID=A0AAU7AXD3_9ACTN